jgi:alpha-tubulin suppressor-like RCC1 family protein
VNLSHQSVQQVSCGNDYTLILTAQGNIYGFGLNSSGQLGIGNTHSMSIPTKTLVPTHTKIAKIAAGYHSLALSTKGEFFIWGECSLGRYIKPHKYISNDNLELTSFEMGCDFTIGVDDKGYVWGFGNNSSGELGQGNLESYDSMIPISYLNSIEIKSISCGKSFVIALADYSVDLVSENETRQFENKEIRHSHDHRADQEEEYLESSEEDREIITSNADSLSARAPSPLRTNPDVSSKNIFNISGQKTPPRRTGNHLSHSKEEYQESETYFIYR